VAEVADAEVADRLAQLSDCAATDREAVREMLAAAIARAARVRRQSTAALAWAAYRAPRSPQEREEIAAYLAAQE
jgi:hypothetical protein